MGDKSRELRRDRGGGLRKKDDLMIQKGKSVFLINTIIHVPLAILAVNKPHRPAGELALSDAFFHDLAHGLHALVAHLLVTALVEAYRGPVAIVKIKAEDDRSDIETGQVRHDACILCSVLDARDIQGLGPFEGGVLCIAGLAVHVAINRGRGDEAKMKRSKCFHSLHARNGLLA